MSRTPTTTDTTVEWQERVTDPDSGSLTLSLTLDAVDDGTGFTSQGTDSSSLSWLSFTKTTSTLNDGTLEALVDIVANKSGLQQGYTYRFKVTADDGTTAVDRTFTLSIKKPPAYSGDTLYSIEDENGSQVYQHSLAGKYDASSINTNVDTTSWSSTSPPDPESLMISPDGGTIVVGNNNDGFYQYSLTPGDLSTLSYVQKSIPPSSVGRITSMYYADKANKLYVGDSYYGRLHEFNWNNPFDVSTLNQVRYFETDWVNGITFSPDGSLMYIYYMNNNGSSIKEFSLLTPFNIDTRTQNYKFGDGGNGDLTGYDGISISPSGKKILMFEFGYIRTVPLSTPFDLSTHGSLKELGYNSNINGDFFHIGP
jgi:hypothetical protein